MREGLMRFWPFGREESRDVEYVSRVVTAQSADGAEIRAKLNLLYTEPVPEDGANTAADATALSLKEMIAARRTADLVGAEDDLASHLLHGSASAGALRAVEVVALHVVGAEVEGGRRARMPSVPSLSSAPRSRRPSSSQMLAVRDSRLVPPGATASDAGVALAPLLKDASTKLLTGVLRAYDLVVLRQVDLSGGEDVGDLVPVSTVAPGRFDLDRKAELSRWESSIGAAPIASLRSEAHALVCFMLDQSLKRAAVDERIRSPLVDTASRVAFPGESLLDELPPYGTVEDPAPMVAVRVLAILTEGSEAPPTQPLAAALGPVIESVAADFEFTSGQVKLSHLRPPTT
jgi:hypothetical protein